jgi:homoserine dehydrogenase
MDPVNVGIIGLGNVGSGTMEILWNNWKQNTRKLGFPLWLRAICSRTLDNKKLPEGMERVIRTTDWRDVVANPEIDIVCELIGGTTVAREVIEAAIANGKSVVTANKELLALHGPGIWRKAAEANVNLAMEASVAGGIPIHTVLREGIAGDRIASLFGVLNGTSNFILSEIENRGAPFSDVLAEAQRLGYAEADPTADVDGFDAGSKLAILAALAFGQSVAPAAIPTAGIRRITPFDFEYAHQLGYTIKLLCSARRQGDGLELSVRPALLARTAILAGVSGAYNGIWVRGEYGQDTFYYGRGAGPLPTGVAVVSDLMRVAREIRAGSHERVSPFAHAELREAGVASPSAQRKPYYLRFRVNDRPGIIASLAGALAAQNLSLDAVLQVPCGEKDNLPFVITVEATEEPRIQAAVAAMATLDFLVEPPLALPMERGV